MIKSGLAILAIFLAVAQAATAARGADVFIRVKVVEPAAEHFRITVTGSRHEDPWYLPTATADVATSNTWSEWIDLRKWPLHGRLDRAGGIAAGPSGRVTIARVRAEQPIAR